MDALGLGLSPRKSPKENYLVKGNGCCVIDCQSLCLISLQGCHSTRNGNFCVHYLVNFSMRWDEIICAVVTCLSVEACPSFVLICLHQLRGEHDFNNHVQFACFRLL